jgi:hypothetical protein
MLRIRSPHRDVPKELCTRFSCKGTPSIQPTPTLWCTSASKGRSSSLLISRISINVEPPALLDMGALRALERQSDQRSISRWLKFGVSLIALQGPGWNAYEVIEGSGSW